MAPPVWHFLPPFSLLALRPPSPLRLTLTPMVPMVTTITTMLLNTFNTSLPTVSYRGLCISDQPVAHLAAATAFSYFSLALLAILWCSHIGPPPLWPSAHATVASWRLPSTDPHQPLCHMAVAAPYRHGA